MSMNVFKNLLALANITAYLDVYCAYHVEMIVKSVFTVISVIRPKLLKFARKDFSKMSDTKGGGTNFSSLGWGKKRGGTKIFPKS